MKKAKAKKTNKFTYSISASSAVFRVKPGITEVVLKISTEELAKAAARFSPQLKQAGVKAAQKRKQNKQEPLPGE